ncbi:MAG: TIGR04282 family arsenosugar biosynthesis glycosyltransferase [Planctomycetes bacterium]|nr:TIGR04282 family arsenosugar biosynthesis glycosyltransferase [Planctomycetota bacterium]
MNVLGVFAKHWTPGAVKTRLAASIGNDAAARLYRAFVDCTLERFAATGDERVLAYWPPEQADAFQPYERLGWRTTPQSSGDLGERMRRFFEDALHNGAERAVLIGSDSPTLPVALVREAFEQLKSHEVVVGPSPDGGYYLVGIGGRIPPIFDDVTWSTSHVWTQTTSRLNDAGAPYAVLPEWYDVDDERDLQRLAHELDRLAADDPAWRPLWREVQCSIV